MFTAVRSMDSDHCSYKLLHCTKIKYTLMSKNKIHHIVQNTYHNNRQFIVLCAIEMVDVGEQCDDIQTRGFDDAISPPVLQQVLVVV